MVQVSVDYEGREHTVEADGQDTHVVASTRAEGGLRLQPTDTPAETMASAQQDGDEDCRVATIDDGKAIFTVVPGYDATEQTVAQKDRRSRRVQYAVVAAVVIALVLLVLLL